eukprot:TRINITY_DN13888_c0_g1_i2.p1 TRINITY_DN13888_c0_g1~~TRINITY_DN13888_c0_g1_i2.p1  ORF type:complete len:449 (-),score=106.65 TRINITY_DN13888_c0_g1_i2:735-2021(-)
MSFTSQKMARVNLEQAVDLKIFELETRLRKLVSEQVQGIQKREKEATVVAKNLAKTVELQGRQIGVLQGEVKSCENVGAAHEERLKEAEETSNSLQNQVNKANDQIDALRTDNEVYRYSVSRKIDQIRELEASIGNLKGTMANYTNLLIDHKETISTAVESLALKLEGMQVQTELKFDEVQGLCQTMHAKEDTKCKQVAKVQASCEIVQGQLNSNKSAIANIKEAKADKTLLKYVEKLCDQSIRSNASKHANLAKEIGAVRERVSKTEEGIKEQFSAQVNNLQYEIKELNADNNLRRRVSDNIIREIKAVQAKVLQMATDHNTSKQIVLESFTNEFKSLYAKIAELSSKLVITNKDPALVPDKPLVSVVKENVEPSVKEIKLPEILSQAKTVVQIAQKKESMQPIDKARNFSFSNTENINMFSRYFQI